MNADYHSLEDLVRTRYASVAWTHKIQEKQAEIYEGWSKALTTLSVFSASLTSAGVVSLVFTDETWLKVASVAVSFVTIFVSAMLKSFNLQDQARQTKAAAIQFVKLRDELLTLLFRIRTEKQPVQGLVDEFEEMQQRVHAAYQEAPNTSRIATRKAEIALEITKDNTFPNDEIDLMLPDSLKRGHTNE